MGLAKILVIIILLTLAAAYFFPTQFADMKDSLLGNEKKEVDKPTNDYNPPTNVGQIGDNDDEETTINETEEETIINETEEVELTEEEAEICDRLYSDYPDYYGTTKWGQDCSDGIIPDEECLEYPPERYQGEIDLTTMESNPKINCCLSDGKCYWG